MCPPGPPPNIDIGVYWTDKDLIECLDKIQHGYHLPGNVLDDINPFNYEPSNLPGDVWYYLRSENQSENERGSWKVKGKECQIYSSSNLTGWRTTFEFVVGPSGPSQNERKVIWMIQKYWITLNGSNNLKASGSLCRVFSCDGECRKNKRQRSLLSSSLVGEENLSVEEVIFCNSQNGSALEPPVNVRQEELISAPPGENEVHVDCFSTGNYLELLDLVNHQSSSSSSDNSSCVSMASDEVFDYLALLKDLEPESTKVIHNLEPESTKEMHNLECKSTKEVHDMEPESTKKIHSKSTSSKFNVSMSTIRKEVFVSPATSGSLVTGEVCPSDGGPFNEKNPPHDLGFEEKFKHKNATKHVGRILVYKNGSDPLPYSHEVSTSQAQIHDKSKKTSIGKMKMLKKYLCFMPF